MSKSRILNGAEASRRHGVLAGTYAAAIMHADPLADAAAEALHSFPDRWWSMVVEALEKGCAAVPDAPPELAALVAALPPDPGAEEREKMERGRAAIARVGDSAGLVLQCLSLVIDCWSPPAMKPFLLSGTLKQDPIQRLVQTGAWWIDLHGPGGLAAGADGYRATLHIRLTNAFIRRLVRGSGAWDRAAWGEPINQADLFLQVVGYSKVMIDSLQRMGYRLTTEEREGYFLLWRHVAALLGVEKSLLPYVNEADCWRYWDLWMLTNPGPDAEGIALARTMLEAMAGAGGRSAAGRQFNLWTLRGAIYWLLRGDIGRQLGQPFTQAAHILPLLYKPAIGISGAVSRLTGRDRDSESSRASRKPALGFVPEGAQAVSAPERLAALARFEPRTPAPRT